MAKKMTQERIENETVAFVNDSLRAQLRTAEAELAEARAVLKTLADQSSGVPGSTARADCMAAMAKAALAKEQGR